MNEAHSTSRLRFETVASIVAMLVGVSALFVAWDQAQIMRKQQHASVLPVVNVSAGLRTTRDDHALTVTFSNGGIGPAVIKSAALKIGGEDVSGWPDFAERLLPPALRSGAETSFDSAIGILAAGDEAKAIEITWPRTEEVTPAIEELRTRILASTGAEIDFTLCYCSVFDRCWVTSAQETAVSRAVKRCEDEGHDVVARILQTFSKDPQS